MENSIDTTALCEAQLRTQKEWCFANKCWPSWVAIIDTMFARKVELRDAYQDLCCALNYRTHALDAFFDALLCATAVWNQDRIPKMREARRCLTNLNKEIADLAAALAVKLSEREEIQNTYPVHADTAYHIVDLMDEAAANNGHYTGWVKEPLDLLVSRFDLKYWPDIPSILSVISQDAETANIGITDNVSRAALESVRTSKADAVRAHFARVQNETMSDNRMLPRDFRLKDDTWASFLNCALDLEVEALLDGAYIKRLRQRLRENEKSAH